MVAVYADKRMKSKTPGWHPSFRLPPPPHLRPEGLQKQVVRAHSQHTEKQKRVKPEPLSVCWAGDPGARCSAKPSGRVPDTCQLLLGAWLLHAKPQTWGAVPHSAFSHPFCAISFSELSGFWSWAVTFRPADVPEQGTWRGEGLGCAPRGVLRLGEKSGECGIGVSTAGSGLKEWFPICKVFHGLIYP